VVTALWSVKGGSGTSVVAAALALLLARREGAALAVDLAGDLPAVLGLPEPDGPGLAAWTIAGDDVAVDALGRLEVDGGVGLAVLARGVGALDAGRADVLASVLGAEPRPVVVDCGTAPEGLAAAVAAGATASLLVTRPCFLALRRAVAAPLRPSGVVLVREDGRALGRRDVEEVLGAPVRAELHVDPAVARAVDAGLLSARLPRLLERALRAAA
jgi:MinD-like ATPase involved in chromosome partitioning or flagellar assembly